MEGKSVRVKTMEIAMLNAIYCCFELFTLVIDSTRRKTGRRQSKHAERARNMSQPPRRTEHEFPRELRESGGRARNIKTDASHPMYKTDKNMQNAVVVSSVGRRSFVSFFVCVPCHQGVRGRGVSFRQTQHNRKPWICMQGARNIRKRVQSKK